MNRLQAINDIRNNLAKGDVSVGSWMQFSQASIAEVMGQLGYDWVAVDLEHGSIGHQQLPDLFRALELGNTLPLVRLAEGLPKDCKQALDAGAGGVIVPMVESAKQLLDVRNACRWPPAGIRGVGFSRANLFGKNFDVYREEAQAPLLVAMIEHRRSVDCLEEILEIEGLDAILIGPYDLSASMGLTAQFDHPIFLETLASINAKATKNKIPVGIHVVQPEKSLLQRYIDEGYQFIAYSIDAVFLYNAAQCPSTSLPK
jgi:2-dehydro-3-deoxyglucarate aldolase